MTNTKLIPFASIVAVESYEPLKALWHIPETEKDICPGCDEKVEQCSILFDNHTWHPECFRCSLCDKCFDNNKCVSKDDLLLHPKCYKQCFCERCAKCTGLISPKKNIKALGKNYHNKCFTCTKCGNANIQEKFFSIFNLPYCSQCYEDVISNAQCCLVCKKFINPALKVVEFIFHGKKYSVHKECARCNNCPNSLEEDQRKFVYYGLLYCQKCYELGMSRICGFCNEPIFGQGNKLFDVWWHSNHFTCTICGQPLMLNNSCFNTGILECKTCYAKDATTFQRSER